MATIPKEINLAKPNEFNGDHKYARCFLSSCETYLHLNQHIYTTDELKINFILAFMQEGSAGDWAINKETLASTLAKDKDGKTLSTTVSYGLWGDFKNDFRNTFITTNDTVEASQQLISLKQTSTVDDYNNQFQSLITRSGMAGDNNLIPLYEQGLNHSLLSHVLTQSNLPKTIQEWYSTASKADSVYRRLQTIRGLGNPTTKHTSNFTKFRSNQQQAQTTMHTTQGTSSNRPLRLTEDEHTKCLHEGRCLACHEKGHNTRDCTKYKHTPNPQRTICTIDTAFPIVESTEPTMDTPNSVTVHICHLITQLNKEQQDEVFNILDKSGF
ncbi:hypothetical protein M0805_004205 [Coniferiporia weirii]|nr:hypothetical protein M0805_004205 [Coniferiporia weirii]